MQRTLIVGAGIVVIVGLAVGVYFLFFNGSAMLSVAPSPSPTLPSAGEAPSTNAGNATGGNANATQPTKRGATGAAPRLVEIDKGPVVPGVLASDVTVAAGVGSTSVAAADVVVRYIARASGNVFAYQIGTGTTTRTSNRTVPGIERALFAPDGSRAYVEYLSGAESAIVNTYALPADGGSGFFLPQNLADLAVSSTSLLALASGANGSIATSERLDGTKPIQAFSTALSLLRVGFLGKNYFAFTKPSGALSGYAFGIDGAGNLYRVAGPRLGLVALPSPSGKRLLVSYIESGALRLELVDLVTRITLPLPVATIADKCVWAPSDAAIYCGVPVSPPSGFLYPDDWYQGAVHFSDRIWKIDVQGRYAQLVLDFTKATNGALDAEALAVDPTLRELVVVNKNDSSLWAYQL